MTEAETYNIGAGPTPVLIEEKTSLLVTSQKWKEGDAVIAHY